MRLLRFLLSHCRTSSKQLLAGLVATLSPGLAVSDPVVLILGDSLSAAYGINPSQGWVTLLQSALSHDYPDSTVINASISGETTVGGLARLPGLLEEYHPDAVIIQLGANDGLRGYPLNLLKKNLGQLARLGQESGSSVLLVQMHIPPNYGSRYTEQFGATYTVVAEKHSVMLAPFLLRGVAGNPDYTQPDGLHPRASAQPIILENVLPHIKKLLAETYALAEEG
jgi:acyl-CoA thioesterase-1